MPPRQKYPQGKRALYVYINEDLYTKIRELSVSQSDKTHGALSAIVEEALRLYLSVKHPPTPLTSLGGEAHTHKAQTGVLQGEIKIKENFNKVLSAYRKIMNYSETDIICEIRESDLVKAISTAIGSDKRTIEKWVNNFLNHNLLRKTKGAYVVVSSACQDIEEYTSKTG